MMRQLPLAIRLRDFAVFESFEPGPNGAVVGLLQDPAAAGPATWIWGPEGSGKSHLLQAACAASPSAAYLPLTELLAAEPGVLQGWEERRIVCIDDIDHLAGLRDWELAAFALFNRLWERGGRVIVAARGSPVATPFALEDLRSRLAWGGVFRLDSLGDEDRALALRRRAAYRGLELPADVAGYLMRRLPRDMRALCGWLDTLDIAALAAGKRLTIPFVKSVIGTASAGSPVSPS